MSSDKEKRKSILHFYEGKTKTRHGEVSHQLDALLVKAAKKTASTATQVIERYRDALEPTQIRDLEKIGSKAKGLVEVPEEERSPAWVRDVVEGLDRINTTINTIYEKVLGEQRKRYWLGLGVMIVIALVGWAIALDIIQWSPGG